MNREAMIEYLRRHEEEKYRYFVPNGKQEEVINEIGCGDNFIVVFSAANGLGKTAVESIVLSNIIYGANNPWFTGEPITWTDKDGKKVTRPKIDLPLFTNFPFKKRGRIASTGKNLEDIGAINGEIETWFPKDKYEIRKNQHKLCEIKANDFVIDLMSYDVDKEQYESANLGFIMFDEPPPLHIFTSAVARMRTGGIIMLFMTPLSEGGEILDWLDEKQSLVDDIIKIGNIKIIYGDVEEGCKEHGIRGHLEHKYIEQMISFYDEDEKEARIKGFPSHMTGKIFKDFNPVYPYVVDDFIIPKDWCRVMIVDPHDAIPFCITWAAIDPAGQVYIYDEYPFEDIDKIKNTNLTYIDYNRIIREKEKTDEIFLRIIDPFFGNKRITLTDRTVKEELKEYGLKFEDGSTDGIEFGHMKIKEFLKYNKEYPVTAINTPKMHILDKCRNHKRSFNLYKRKLEKDGGIKEKSVIEQTFKHHIDNVRHLLSKDVNKILENFKYRNVTYSNNNNYNYANNGYDENSYMAM